MPIKYPEELDTDTELYEVEDGVDDVYACHHNMPKDAVKELEAKVGVDSSTVVTSIDYILNNKMIPSTPPSGYYRVTNLYVRPEGTKLVVEYDDTPAP